MLTRFGRFISGKSFTRLFLTLYALVAVFSAYETAASLSLLAGKNLYIAVYAVFLLISVAVVTKKALSAVWNNRVYRRIVSSLSCWFIYYLPVLCLWEVLCLIFAPSDMIRAIGAVASAGLGALVVLLGHINTRLIRIKRYDIRLGKGNRSCNIALISDIHLGIFVGEKHIAKTVRRLNSLSPDVVVIAGDIFDVDRSLMSDAETLGRISRQFRRIKAREGVYAVAGNHDPGVTDPDFVRFLGESGIELLDNGSRELSDVVLVGRTDGGNNLRRSCGEIIPQSRDKPVVVLDHDPQGIDEAVENGASLVLCGHTHRGQLFPVNLFTKWANGRRHFYGHEQYGNAHSIITSGIGFFELPVRIGTDNEISYIHLTI